MKTLKDVAKAGCKDLIADYDTLIVELEKYFHEQIEFLTMKDRNYVPHAAYELMEHVFGNYRIKTIIHHGLVDLKEKAQ